MFGRHLWWLGWIFPFQVLDLSLKWMYISVGWSCKYYVYVNWWYWLMVQNIYHKLFSNSWLEYPSTVSYFWWPWLFFFIFAVLLWMWHIYYMAWNHSCFISGYSFWNAYTPCGRFINVFLQGECRIQIEYPIGYMKSLHMWEWLLMNELIHMKYLLPLMSSSEMLK